MPPSENPTTSKFLRSSARQKSAQSFVIAATVDGVSPLELPTPALSTRMTSRSAAKPFVSLGSQLSVSIGPVSLRVGSLYLRRPPRILFLPPKDRSLNCPSFRE